MTPTDRLLVLVPQKLQEFRQALDNTPDLNSVQILIQVDKKGDGVDRVTIRTEAGLRNDRKVR